MLIGTIQRFSGFDSEVKKSLRNKAFFFAKDDRDYQYFCSRGRTPKRKAARSNRAGNVQQICRRPSPHEMICGIFCAARTFYASCCGIVYSTLPCSHIFPLNLLPISGSPSKSFSLMHTSKIIPLHSTVI